MEHLLYSMITTQTKGGSMKVINGIVIVAVTSLLLIGTASAARRLVVGEMTTNTS